MAQINFVKMSAPLLSYFFLILGTIVSIAFFNFAGISVTKEISATTRMVLDSVRTIIIWIFSIICFGQAFHWLQVFFFVCFYCVTFTIVCFVTAPWFCEFTGRNVCLQWNYI